jgi:hypothetical protein
MPSKRFQNRPCIYCTAVPATTADHVMARQLLPKDARANLPKVPACQACNNTKSQIEHYLATVLPFASRIPAAKRELTDNVPKRLARNVKLHREIKANHGRGWSVERSGIILPTMTIPVDSEKLNAYIGYLVRGLMWHHWQVLLDKDHFVDVLCLTHTGEKFFDHLSRWRGSRRLEETIGNGALSYMAIQGTDRLEISVWVLSLFNGLKVAGSDHKEQASRWGVMTGPIATQEVVERRVRSIEALNAMADFDRRLARRRSLS